MASIDRRIAALERLYTAEAASSSGTGERLLKDFFRRALDAMAHVRPAEAKDERPEFRYEVGRLRSESPVTVAAYVAALSHLQHPDEAEAREILEETTAERGIDPATLEKLMAAFGELARRAEEQR